MRSYRAVTEDWSICSYCKCEKKMLLFSVRLLLAFTRIGSRTRPMCVGVCMCVCVFSRLGCASGCAATVAACACARCVHNRHRTCTKCELVCSLLSWCECMGAVRVWALCFVCALSVCVARIRTVMRRMAARVYARVCVSLCAFVVGVFRTLMRDLHITG